jgi:hypothetical protein
MSRAQKAFAEPPSQPSPNQPAQAVSGLVPRAPAHGEELAPPRGALSLRAPEVPA